MELLPVSDFTHDAIVRICDQYLASDKETVAPLLEKLPNPFFVILQGTIAGFLNIKPREHTLFIPLYLNHSFDTQQAGDLLQALNGILSDHTWHYIVFSSRNGIPHLLETLMPLLQVCNYALLFRNPHAQAGYAISRDTFTWKQDLPDRDLLLPLYLKSFVEEREYVGNSWDVVLDCFYADDKPKYCLSCYDGDTLIGNILGQEYPDKVYLHTICVLPQYNHLGIGNSLMRHFLNHYAGRMIELHCYADNLGAIALYEKYGFHKVQVTNVVATSLTTEAAPSIS